MGRLLNCCFLFTCLLSQTVFAQLADYKKVVGINGAMTAVGSDTLARTMTEWERAFRALYPGVNLQLQAAGSSTAPIGLIQGTTDIGMMSRGMKQTELKSFYQAYGYYPTKLTVAMDAEVILVNRENPLKQVSIEQLDMMYSNTYRCGGNQQINNWQQLGISDDNYNQKIQLFARNSSSGTYVYFKQKALCNGDFRPSVNELPSASFVVDSVARAKYAIGFAAIGYRNELVKTLPIAIEQQLVAPTPEFIRSKKYPLSRELYFYLNQQPDKKLKPVIMEFLRFIYSNQGQAIVEKMGFVSLPAEQARAQLQKLNR